MLALSLVGCGNTEEDREVMAGIGRDIEETAGKNTEEPEARPIEAPPTEEEIIADKKQADLAVQVTACFCIKKIQHYAKSGVGVKRPELKDRRKTVEANVHRQMEKSMIILGYKFSMGEDGERLNSS